MTAALPPDLALVRDTRLVTFTVAGAPPIPRRDDRRNPGRIFLAQDVNVRLRRDGGAPVWELVSVQVGGVLRRKNGTPGAVYLSETWYHYSKDTPPLAAGWAQAVVDWANQPTPPPAAPEAPTCGLLVTADGFLGARGCPCVLDQDHLGRRCQCSHVVEAP